MARREPAATEAAPGSDLWAARGDETAKVRAVGAVSAERETQARAPATSVLSTPKGQSHGTGIALLVVGMMIMPVMDGIGKQLSTEMSPVQAAWARFAFQALFTAPMVLVFAGWRGLLPPRPGLQVLRGALLAGSTMALFAGLRHLPLAESLAIAFLFPLLATAISALLLREHVGLRRWSAIGVGFLGALIVIRPGSGLFGTAVLWPVLCAVFFAFYIVLTRRLAVGGDPWSIHFATGAAGAVVISLLLAVGAAAGIAPLAPSWPTLGQWALFAVLGFVSTAGHLLVILAYARAPVPVLAPFHYCEIVSATAIGWLAFGDFPDRVSWLGIAVIVASGLYVAHRERLRARTAAGP